LKKRFSDFETSLLAAKEPPLEELAREPIEAKTLANKPKRVRAWLHAFSITPRNSVVKEIMRQANARRDAQVLVRVSPHACVRRHKGLFFVVTDAASIANSCIRVGEDVSFPFGELEWVQRHIGLPRDAEFHIDLRQGGETIAVENQSVKLSKWFYTRDIPQWERDAWPLLYQGERLIAVPGLGVDSSACITNGYVPNWHRTGSYC
jgi:tRNA(Ile)-lysidine synthase